MTIDLYPTKTRRALLDAIAEPGRIYDEAGHTWDHDNGCRVTWRVEEAVRAGWLRPRTDDDPPHPEEFLPRGYYRLTEAGEEARRG